MLNTNEIKHKIVDFSVNETKLQTIDGVKYGVITGYASTYGNVDLGYDRIIPGAFSKSLESSSENKKQIPMFFQHDSLYPIGGYPKSEIVDNETGLFVTGHINLEADKGNSTYALAKQGVIGSMSIGYYVRDSFIGDDGINNLTEIDLAEISMVTHPMNPKAIITDVKSADTIRDVEKFLTDKLFLSKNDSKILISKIKSFARDATNENELNDECDAQNPVYEKLRNLDLLFKLNNINNLLRGK